MNFLWDFLIQRGVSYSDLELIKQIYILLLMIPVVSTIVGISRYIIGTKSLSIYTPIVLTFLFFELGKVGDDQDIMKGLKYGIVLFITVFLSSALFYSMLRKFRMHYVPKLTLVMTGVCFSLMMLILVSLIIGKSGLIFINQYTLIIITIISEPLISAMARKSFKFGLLSAIDTLAVSVLCYIIISVTFLQQFLQDNPWFLLIVIAINIYVGRFAGLRLTEYWRFRNILFKNNQEINDKPNNNSKK